jgi:2-keto-4-pentenoate hydratase
MIDVEARLIAAASLLRGAYLGLRPADLPPDLRPTSPAEAYRIQDLVIGRRGIAGWKVSATAAPDNRTCAALVTENRLADGAVLRRGDRRPDLEVEVAVRIAADLLPRPAPYGRDEVLAALGGAHAAFEIVESRFRDRKRASPLSTLADAQSCRAFVIGSGIEDWQGLNLASTKVSLRGDDVDLSRSQNGASVADTIDALVWLANHAVGRGAGLTAGQFILTGARIGPVEVPAASRISAQVAGIGEVSLLVT